MYPPICPSMQAFVHLSTHPLVCVAFLLLACKPRQGTSPPHLIKLRLVVTSRHRELKPCSIPLYTQSTAAGELALHFSLY